LSKKGLKSCYGLRQAFGEVNPDPHPLSLRLILTQCFAQPTGQCLCGVFLNELSLFIDNQIYYFKTV